MNIMTLWENYGIPAGEYDEMVAREKNLLVMVANRIGDVISDTGKTGAGGMSWKQAQHLAEREH